MSDKLIEPENQDFSRELLHAISADMMMVEADLTVLAGDDLADLKRILRDERIPKIPIDKKRAVNALARSERSVEAGEILASILSNTEELTTVRVEAASNLGMMPAEVAERSLLEHLTSGYESLRSESFKTLCRIGTAEGLAHLKNLKIPDDDYAKKQLAFAKLVIGFRSSSEEWNIQDVNNTLGIRWTTHAAKTIEGTKVQEYIDAIGGSTYGITLNPNIAFELSCGRIKHFIILNDEMKKGAFVDSVRSRVMIAGLIALREEMVAHCTIRYLLLTIPSDTGIVVIITRTNGSVVYVGEARLEGEGLRLTMRDGGLERTPTDIEGFLSNNSIHLNLSIWRGTSRPKNQGEPFPV